MEEDSKKNEIVPLCFILVILLFIGIFTCVAALLGNVHQVATDIP